MDIQEFIKPIWEWVCANKEWVFSGIGGTIIILVITLLGRKHNVSSKSKTISQTSGRDSTYLSADGNMHIELHKPQQVGLAKRAEILLVDFFAVEGVPLPTVEFKLRNKSDEVVFLKRVEIRTLKYWEILSPAKPSAFPATAKYDVKINTRKNATTIFRISHEIKPQQVDRFQIVLHSNHAPYPYMGLFLYLLDFSLIYNEDDRVLKSPNLLIHIQTKMNIMACCDPGPSKSLLRKNKKTALLVLSTIDEGTVYSKRLLEAIRSWAEARI